MRLLFWCSLDAELLRLGLLHSDKVPKYANDESQQGGAVSTRSMKKDLESEKVDLKPLKGEPHRVKRKLEDDDVDMSDLLDDGTDEFLVERAKRLELSENPLFNANLVFLVKKKQFTVTFDQLRQPDDEESLGEGLSEALFTAIRDVIVKPKLPDSTQVHLTLTSKEHGNGTVQ